MKFLLFALLVLLLAANARLAYTASDRLDQLSAKVNRLEQSKIIVIILAPKQEQELDAFEHTIKIFMTPFKPRVEDPPTDHNDEDDDFEDETSSDPAIISA